MKNDKAAHFFKKKKTVNCPWDWQDVFYLRTGKSTFVFSSRQAPREGDDAINNKSSGFL